MRRLAFACAALIALVAPTSAQDRLKVAIGQIDAWTNQAAVLGQRAGIFAKHGIVLENFGTQGGGETIQAVISGAADIGIGIGTVGAMRAFANGAPIRILAASFTGTGDFYWYVKADSPINTLADATEKNTISYSTNGASSHNVVRAFVEELGLKARPTATGGQPATLTQVMSGQIDMGWASPPFGLRQIKEGQIRVVASGNEAASLKSQTVRVEVINANVWKDRHETVLRFMRAFREALDWMFTDPVAVKYYAEHTGASEDMIHLAMEKFQTREAKQPDVISDVEGIMRDGVKFKFLDRPLTREQLAELIQIPPK